MSKSVHWECYPVLFFRLAQHSSRLLTTLRWQSSTLDLFEKALMLHEREEVLQQQFASYRHVLNDTSWIEISRWLEHAHLRKESPLPRILDKYETVQSVVCQLVQVRRSINTLQSEFPNLLQSEFIHIWEEASSLISSDQTLRAALTYTSWDFMSALENAMNTPAHISMKKHRKLLYSFSNYIARGSVKTCPLGLLCGTAIASFGASQTESLIKVVPNLYTTVMPSRALIDGLIRLISDTIPIEHLGAVHFDVSHAVENGKIVFWRMHRDSNQLVEQLQAIKIDHILASVLTQCGETSSTIVDLSHHLQEAAPNLDQLRVRNALQRLLSLGLLCSEARLTAFTQDPLREALLILHTLLPEPSRLDTHWLRTLNKVTEASESFSNEHPFHQQEESRRFSTLLTTLYPIGKEVLGETRSPSTVLSVDSYASIDEPVSAEIRRAIEHTASLSSLLATAAYPNSQECRDREQFLAAFRKAHGDDKPVLASEALNTHWNLFDSTFARAVKADYKKISSVNSHTWPQPYNLDSPYGQIYKKFVAHLKADSLPHQHHIHLTPQQLSDLVDVQPRCAPLVDVICRIAALPHLSRGHTYEVYIESVTLPGRVTHRHWNPLSKLGVQEAQLVEAYRSRLLKDQMTSFDTEVLSVEAFATPLSPNQLNVDQRSDKPPVVLALAEPVRFSDSQRVLRFKDIYLRYDTSANRIISTLGPHGIEIALTYTSPISPSYNRRLHFLRYISLMSYPVLVAPKWFLLEASQQCHIPRIYIDNLVVTPERWAIPLHSIISALSSRHWTQRYADLHIWRKRIGLPDICFAYTNRKTKPLFVDFYSPSGLQNVLELVHQEAETLLFEECYPDVNQQIVQRGAEPVFSSVVATIKRTVGEQIT